MSDRIFLDTNILVYSYSNNEIDKRNIARTLISGQNAYISTQVLQELTNVITKRMGFSYDDARKVIAECSQNNIVHVNSESTILKACEIASLYKYSFYDSLIISAALEINCLLLYSEDMNGGHLIDGKLKIVNPFSI